MNTVFKPLAEIEFSKVLAEAYADTQTGMSVIDKYRKYLLTNEATCTLINNFLYEAKNCMYDQGVASVVEKLTSAINESKVSWQLATACEAINANRSSYNFLNRNAANTVEKLLEQNEAEVVKYIKAGALKNVMFCEAFRNIVNSVFTDCQKVITENYVATHPVSYIEESEGKKYFEVLGRIYSVEGNKIEEAKASDVSGDFLVVSRLLENRCTTVDPNNDRITVDTPLAVYEVYVEEGDCVKCKRTPKVKGANADAPKDKEGKDIKDLKVEAQVFNDEFALREHNRLVVGAMPVSQKAQMAELLEGIARTFEHFENIALLDNTQIIENKNDKFVVIESKENMFAYLVASNHNTGWKISNTVVEALEFIKKQTNLNIAKDYKSNVDEQIAKTEAEKAKQIEEDIKKGEIDARKQKIEALTEKYKDDPATLAVLAKVAQALNEASAKE